MLTKIDYDVLYASAMVNPRRMLEIQGIVKIIAANQMKYSLVEHGTGVPWWCVGAIHNLESSLNFARHLHNGDPLTDRTTHVPAGRPVAAPKNPLVGYSWPESAIDALTGTWRPEKWDRAGCLAFVERYNGLGYALRGVNSPYVWGGTNQYARGLFVADGSFDPRAVSEGAGAAAILKVLSQRGLVDVSP